MSLFKCHEDTGETVNALDTKGQEFEVFWTETEISVNDIEADAKIQTRGSLLRTISGFATEGSPRRLTVCTSSCPDCQVD